MGHQIRRGVCGFYPNVTWAAKVNKMSDDQVYAIWLKHKQRQRTRRYDKAVHAAHIYEAQRAAPPAVQPSLFDPEQLSLDL